jgi:rifampicin phosphotransferase
VTRRLAERGITAARFLNVSAADALDQLQGMPDGLGEAVETLVETVGYRLVSGYDICDSYALEMPDMLLRTIFAESRTGKDRAAAGRLDRVRERVPKSDLPRFDELLGEARFINRLRDERGVYNDLWGGGLARRAVLAAGRRLEKNGVLPDGALAINASNEELVELLRGGREPGVPELRRRQTWRDTKTFADAPPFLGGQPSPPPPAEWLPKHARANARAIDSIIRELFAVSQRKAKARSVEGLAVHPGVYEGPARIVKGPHDFGRLQPGDVLVTRTTGPAFNVVLPLLGALVTDRGGQLSHAAIVAREYGIPAVVGTRDATTTFPDGALVRVDGNAGRVELLS